MARAAAALLVLAAAVGPAGCRGRGAPEAPPPASGGVPGERATESFRAEHVDLKKHLDHLEALVGGLATAAPEEQKKNMGMIAGFLREHIVPHAAWEEQALYPVVDRQAGSGAYPFTASMRHEHTIVGRWIAELEQEAGKPEPDVIAFTRRADNVLGLLRAHFEEEEEVLLPILDKTMTKAEFEAAVGERPHGE